jgi:hypothetical protein
VFNVRQDLAFRGAIGSEFIRHNNPGRVTQALQQLAKEALGRLRVAAALDQHVEHVAVLINGPPEVVQFALDADKYLIQKPLVAGLRSTPVEALGVGASEAQAPLTDGLVADHDVASGQDRFDFTQAQAEAAMKPNRLVDNLG